MDLSALSQISAAVGTQLMVQAAAAVPGWTLRLAAPERGRHRADGSRGGLRALGVRRGVPGLGRRGVDRFSGRELGIGLHRGGLCAALIAGLGSSSAAARFQTAAFDALESAGADIDELGRFFDMEEFVCLLPQRLYENLLQIAAALRQPAPCHGRRAARAAECGQFKRPGRGGVATGVPQGPDGVDCEH